jgi:hypothetical protein
MKHYTTIFIFFIFSTSLFAHDTGKDTQSILKDHKIFTMSKQIGNFLFDLSEGRAENYHKYFNKNPRMPINLKPIIKNFEDGKYKVQSVDLVAYKFISTGTVVLYYVLNTDVGPVGVEFGCYVYKQKVYLRTYDMTFRIKNILDDISKLEELPQKFKLTPVKEKIKAQ